MERLDELAVNTLRFLAVDQVEAAKSGHPGLPLGAAPMAYVLWDRFLRQNPSNPAWANRDRFVLSAGHGSALLYALLHVYGFGLTLDDLKHFRQWGSKTPGHPEHGHVPGVEATTGPLGQGFAMGVGMAIAEAHLAATFNRPGHEVVDHFTYALVSDGDLMEGISSEAASLAGHLKLGKLIYLYDDNKISIEGSTALAFTEDVGMKFQAFGWHVQKVSDGNDLSAIGEAITKAQAETERPSLIMVRTHIGYGSPKQDTSSAHGEPLGPEAARATKEALGWPADKAFYVPEEVARHAGEVMAAGRAFETLWNSGFDAYREAHPDLAAAYEAAVRGDIPPELEVHLPSFGAQDGSVATRSASGKTLNALAPHLEGLMGGSADLAPSNSTNLKGYASFAPGDRSGRNMHFGVREHAMAAIVNGMALHGGLIPYAGTFLVFSDYARPALRLAALMQTRSIFVFTHDSIGLGEDGPTHQPVSQLVSLRAIPGLTVLRPADANETAAAWWIALNRRGPTALALTRQGLPVLDPGLYPIREGVPKGAYILKEAAGGPAQVILLATGSEVALALQAEALLSAKGIRVRVVSMPSWELFAEQPETYRRMVLPATVPKLAVEAASPMGWREFVGDSGDVLGLDRFGASAPGKEVMAHLGFTAEHVAELAEKLISKR